MNTVKLHLGCGKRFLKGYVHVDLADFPHIDHRHDIRSLPMFADNSIDLIYSSHGLEYFDRKEVLEVLAEWRRTLKAGGILRLAVPDFEALAKVYHSQGKLEMILGPLYGRWEIPGSGEVVYHRTVYDRCSLEKVLAASGFKNARPWDWREVFSGALEGYDDYSQAYLPHMDKEHGLLVSLNIEAEK